MTKQILNQINKGEEEILKDIMGGKYRDYYLIYNRKSTDEPENQKNSLKYQKSENVRFAYRQHLKIAAVTIPGFCLDGVIPEKHSGFKEDSELTFGKDGMIQYRIERPKFFRLVQFLNNGFFKGVIFLCWDRASRNKGDNNIINKLNQQGVDFQFALASYDKTSAGALHMDIDGMFAEHNSRVTREKVTLTIRNKREQGICTYKAPVGYLNLGQMEHKPIDSVRAPIIIKMFELYATGEWSLSSLARWANSQGFTMPPTRRRKTTEERLAEEEDDIHVVIKPICRPITAYNVHAILKRHFYIGEIMGNNNQYIRSNSHQALITRKLFDQVQKELISKNVSVHYAKSLNHPMRGILRCADCKRLYTPYPKKGVLYFGSHCHPDCKNPNKSVNLKFLSDSVGQLIHQLSFTDMETIEINKRAKSYIQLKEKHFQSQYEIDERRKKKLKEDLAYLLDNKLALLKSGVYSPESLMTEEESLNKKLLAILQSESVSGASMLEKVADLVKLSELLKSLYFYYEKAIPNEKESIIRIIFSELTLFENSFKYKCKKGFDKLETRFMVFGARETWLSELIKHSASVNESIDELNAFLNND